MPTCPKCQTENPEGAKFCRSCGQTLGSAKATVQQTTPSPSSSPTPQPGAKIKNWDDFILTLDKFFKTLPVLPLNVREYLARLAPWFALLGGIGGILGFLAALGFNLIAAPFAFLGFLTMGPGRLISLTLKSLVMVGLSLGVTVYNLLAFRPLQKKVYQGWKFLFFAMLISSLQSLLHFSMSGLVWDLVEIWLLFQIKEYYS